MQEKNQYAMSDFHDKEEDKRLCPESILTHLTSESVSKSNTILLWALISTLLDAKLIKSEDFYTHVGGAAKLLDSINKKNNE